jgi:hypothetical protein
LWTFGSVVVVPIGCETQRRFLAIVLYGRCTAAHEKPHAALLVAHFDEDSGFVALDKPALFEFDLGTTRLNHASRTLIAFFAMPQLRRMSLFYFHPHP